MADFFAAPFFLLTQISAWCASLVSGRMIFIVVEADEEEYEDE